MQSSPLIHMDHRIDGVTLEQMPVCQEIWGTQDYRPATSHTLFWRGPTPPGEPGEPDDPLVLLPCQGRVSLSPTSEARVRSSSRQDTRWEIEYAAEGPVVATIPQYYFPGWNAWVDGAATALGPSPGNGPLHLEYRDTAVRSAGNTLSVLGIAASVALAWSARAEARRAGRHPI
jgi:hypothetical protein